MVCLTKIKLQGFFFFKDRILLLQQENVSFWNFVKIFTKKKSELKDGI